MLRGAATFVHRLGGTRGRDEPITKMLLWSSPISGKLTPCTHGDGGRARGQREERRHVAALAASGYVATTTRGVVVRDEEQAREEGGRAMVTAQVKSDPDADLVWVK
jgi:hypothetical protein